MASGTSAPFLVIVHPKFGFQLFTCQHCVDKGCGDNAGVSQMGKKNVPNANESPVQNKQNKTKTIEEKNNVSTLLTRCHLNVQKMRQSMLS